MLIDNLNGVNIFSRSRSPPYKVSVNTEQTSCTLSATNRRSSVKSELHKMSINKSDEHKRDTTIVGRGGDSF